MDMIDFLYERHGDADFRLKCFIDELLHIIYMNLRNEDDEIELTEKAIEIAAKELNVKKEQISWEKVEDWLYEYELNLTDIIDDIYQVEKILKSIRLYPDSFSEEKIYADMDIKQIKQLILKKFENAINNDWISEEELKKSLLNS